MEILFVVILLALFVAAFLQRLAGFGYGLIGAPVALCLFSPFEVSFLMAFWGTANSLPTTLLLRQHVPWQTFRTLLVWLLLGLILGYAGLLFLPPVIFKMLAILICLQALVSVYYPEHATRSIGWTADYRIAATLAGTLQSSVSIPGPPLVVAFNAMRLTHNAFVSLFSLVFLGVGLVRIAVSFGFMAIAMVSPTMAERLPDHILLYAVTGAAVSVLGVLTAQPLVSRVSSALFKKIAAGLIALSALTLLTDVLGWSPHIAALFGVRS